MNIDLVQVVTNLVVGVVSAWFTSKLALRRGLEQSKKEKAFDRRLEWYEKAFRATIRFRHFNEEIAIALRKDDLKA